MKERLVICNEEDTDGRVRVTADEERVTCRLNSEQRLILQCESNLKF